MDRAARNKLLEKLRERSRKMEHLSEEHVDKVVAYLNELVALDKDAIERLIEARVPCNEKMASHPHVQVQGAEGNAVVGLLGIVNGLMGAQPEGANKVHRGKL